MIKMSEIFLTSHLNKLFFVLFNLGECSVESGKEQYKIKINYKNSKYSSVKLSPEIVEHNNQLMTNFFDLPFQIKGISTHVIDIENDTNFTRDEILNRLYAHTQRQRFNYSDKAYSESMILSFFIPRGSMDLTRNYYSVDILERNVSEDYFTNLLNLLSSIDDIKQLNLNFRELQHEYVTSAVKRNSQLRINLRWLYDNYIDMIKKINIFKANILKESSTEIKRLNTRKSLDNSFIERALFYKTKIIQTKNSSEILSKKGKDIEIKKLRKELNFDSLNSNDDTDIRRNSDVVKLAIASQVDECVCCKNKYNLMDRTFRRASNGKPYLEIHHVISFGANKKGDTLDNLVKVCPACHRALTPGRAEESYQKELIYQILKNSPTANRYVENFVETKIEKDKVNYVLANLR